MVCLCGVALCWMILVVNYRWNSTNCSLVFEGLGVRKLHNVWNLWIRSPLGMSQEESLAGTHIGLHMSTAFVLVDIIIIIIKHGTSGGKGGFGSQRVRGALAGSRVCICERKGKESKDILTFLEWFVIKASLV